MPINQLVEFCNANHNRPNRCDDCPNETCYESCILCLEQIHRVVTRDRLYNCENIIHCYTCKFIYRYSTEIEYLLNQYVNIFRNTQNVRIWSIGCGPCTELFGLYNFKINNELDFVIDYKGFDLNTLWRPIHDFINQMDEFQTNFFYEDLFIYAQRTNEQPNVIVLNYLISDILRTNSVLIDSFITDFCDFINQIDFCVIIINDINLGRNNTEPRFYYNIILNRIREQTNRLREGKFHFTKNNDPYYAYFQPHINNQVQLVPANEIIATYNPWMECGSAQLFILKQPRQ